MRSKRKEPEMTLRDGKPAAVVLGIDRYREILERPEDAEDLKALTDLRKRPLRFRLLERFLQARALLA